MTKMFISSKRFFILLCVILPVVSMAKVRDEKSQKRFKRFNSPSNAKKTGFSDNDEDYFYEETDREIKKSIPVKLSHNKKGLPDHPRREDDREVDIEVKLKHPKEEMVIEKDKKILRNRNHDDYDYKETENVLLPPLKLNIEDENLQDVALIRKSTKASTAEIKRFVDEVARKILWDADQYYEELAGQMRVDSSFSGWKTGDFPQLHEIEDDDLDAMFSPSSVSLASSHLVNSGVDGDNDVSLYDYGRQADGFNTEC